MIGTSIDNNVSVSPNRGPTRIVKRVHQEWSKKIRSAIAASRDQHGETVGLIRTMTRSGGRVRFTALRRALRLASCHAVRRHALVLALHEVYPEAYVGKPGAAGSRRYATVMGVHLAVDLATLRKSLAERWEKRLAGEDMPAEIQQIAQEYKLGHLAPRPGDGRLRQLVRRVHERREDADAYFTVAVDYLHTANWARWPGHKAIWALHCEGATKEAIARETDMAPTSVQAIIDLHRARTGQVMR